MATAACGINCDMCALKEMCGGCVPGTDPKATERLAKLKEMMGAPCPALGCAIKKGIDYCLRCPEFPCQRLYKWEIPYSAKLLHLIDEFKEKMMKDAE